MRNNFVDNPTQQGGSSFISGDGGLFVALIPCLRSGTRMCYSYKITSGLLCGDTKNVDRVSGNTLGRADNFLKRSLLREREADEIAFRPNVHIRGNFTLNRLEVVEDKLPKEADGPFRIVVKHHEVVEVQIGSNVSPNLNSRVIAVLSGQLKLASLLDSSNLHGHTSDREDATTDEVRQIRLYFDGNSTPLVEEQPDPTGGDRSRDST